MSGFWIATLFAARRRKKAAQTTTTLEKSLEVLGGIALGLFIGILIGVFVRAAETKSFKLLSGVIGAAVSGVVLVFVGGFTDANLVRASYAVGLPIGLFIGLRDLVGLSPRVESARRRFAARRGS